MHFSQGAQARWRVQSVAERGSGGGGGEVNAKGTPFAGWNPAERRSAVQCDMLRTACSFKEARGT